MSLVWIQFFSSSAIPVGKCVIIQGLGLCLLKGDAADGGKC